MRYRTLCASSFNKELDACAQRARSAALAVRNGGLQCLEDGDEAEEEAEKPDGEVQVPGAIVPVAGVAAAPALPQKPKRASSALECFAKDCLAEGRATQGSMNRVGWSKEWRAEVTSKFRELPPERQQAYELLNRAEKMRAKLERQAWSKSLRQASEPGNTSGAPQAQLPAAESFALPLEDRVLAVPLPGLLLRHAPGGVPITDRRQAPQLMPLADAVLPDAGGDQLVPYGPQAIAKGEALEVASLDPAAIVPLDTEAHAAELTKFASREAAQGHFKKMVSTVHSDRGHIKKVLYRNPCGILCRRKPLRLHRCMRQSLAFLSQLVSRSKRTPGIFGLSNTFVRSKLVMENETLEFIASVDFAKGGQGI